jgi:hypothetical protein
MKNLTLDGEGDLLLTTLMSNVYWALGQNEFSDYGDFVAAVTRYNQIYADSARWEPDKQISSAPITVVYEAAWKDEDDRLEVVLGERGKVLTMGEMLFRLNNATVEFFKGSDHCFFEGLAVLGGTEYTLLVGS